MQKELALSQLVSYLDDIYVQRGQAEDDEGNVSLTLIGKPRRLLESSTRQPLAMSEIPVEQTSPLPSPATLLAGAKVDDNWLSRSRLAQKSLLANFIFSEDQLHRLVANSIVMLRHQVNLVEHTIINPDLDRVMIVDEVGLGKTLEAIMIILRQLELNPHSRILYLAPASLVPNVVAEFQKMGLKLGCPKTAFLTKFSCPEFGPR